MLQAELSQKLFALSHKEVYRFSEEGFILASGKKSHHYYDCKAISMVPERLALLARCLRDEMIPQSGLALPEAVGGLTLGADPIAYALSLAYWEQGHSVYPFVVRKEAKGHGLAKRIEARFSKQSLQEVLVLDDTVTSGGSALQAIQALREFGLKVNYCLAVVDRGEGAHSALEAAGVSLLSLFRAEDFQKVNRHP